MSLDDAQRIWFPEVIEQLRARWQPGMPFEGLVELRNDLDATLQRVRSEGDIKSPVIRCRQCRYFGPGPEPHVSVRAMILSTARFNIAPNEETYALEKGWSAYRKQHDLDIYGVPVVPGPILAACNHVRAR